MGMKHWWWRTRVSHCSNIMASLFIHEMAAIIWWDSCDDFYHCNEFFNCPCNSCHQKIIFQIRRKHLKRERIFHVYVTPRKLYWICTTSLSANLDPGFPLQRRSNYIAKLSTTLTRFQGGNCWSSSSFNIRYWKFIIEIKYWLLSLNIEICSASIFNISGCGESINGRWILTSVNMSDFYWMELEHMNMHLSATHMICVSCRHIE